MTMFGDTRSRRVIDGLARGLTALGFARKGR